ncbi:MAG: Smr/MutS family protein [Desulfovibrio sp.]|nr:Smr/MutS family protein [Desulfovibrio sp.]
MTDCDNFGENPFRLLDGNLFPPAEKNSKLKLIQKPIKIKKTARQCPENSSPDDDSALFMAAMSRVNPVNIAESRGFLLAEQCSLPERKKSRGKKRSSKKDTPVSLVQESLPHQETTVQNEESEFLQAMGQVHPLKRGGRDVTPAPPAAHPPVPREENLQDFLDGKLEFALSMSDEYLEGYVVGLDQMIMNKLRNGSLSPEAHLDLHGLNAVQAFEALRGFMRGAWYKGLRTVLLVPGRGRNSPDGLGILRSKLQLWLTQDPFKRVVLAFCTAQPHDGGPGSVYVLLRKYRKKGRIYWERMPADADLY